MKINKQKQLALLLLLGLSHFSIAQNPFDHWLKKKEGFKIEPFLSLQLWSTYSIGQETYNIANKQYESVDNRLNFLLRRARFGFRAEPLERVQFYIALAYDGVGRDVNSALVAPGNNGNLPSIGLFDAFLQYKILKNSEGLHVIGGYFRPQLSRESITAAWAVPSMDKAGSQNYLRAHLVGVSPGRALGFNIGGLLLHNHLHYNIGIFNPVFQSNGSNSTGNHYSPLTVGRVALSIGQPEFKNYKIGYDINYYNERKGLTLGVGGARQGKTDLFTNNYTASVDLLFNYNNLNLDGEWNWLSRSGERSLADNSIRQFTYNSQAGHVRLGYNIIAFHKLFLEPTFMLARFQGGLDATAQADAKAVGESSGEDFGYDAGMNWHLQKRNLKIMLHYTWRAGNAGAAGDGATVNQYFSQSNVGAIHRGNWIGLGLNAIF